MNLVSASVTPEMPENGLSDLGPKWVRFATNVKNSGLYQIKFQYMLARNVNILKSDIKKIPDFSHLGPT